MGGVKSGGEVEGMRVIVEKMGRMKSGGDYSKKLRNSIVSLIKNGEEMRRVKSGGELDAMEVIVEGMRWMKGDG